jgi:hypothetical protein
MDLSRQILVLLCLTPWACEAPPPAPLEVSAVPEATAEAPTKPIQAKARPYRNIDVKEGFLMMWAPGSSNAGVATHQLSAFGIAPGSSMHLTAAAFEHHDRKTTLLWAQDFETGQSLLLRGQVEWGDLCWQITQPKEIFRGDGFQHVTALSLWKGHPWKLMVWDSGKHVLSCLASQGEPQKVLSAEEYPALLNKKDMWASGGFLGGVEMLCLDFEGPVLTNSVCGFGLDPFQIFFWGEQMPDGVVP